MTGSGGDGTGTEPDGSPRRDITLAALVAALLAVIVMGRSLGGEWLFDDFRFIVNNEAIDTFDPVGALGDPRMADPGTPPDIYRPLRTISWSLEKKVFGDHPAGFHAVSILLHALNAALVVLLARALGLGPLACALAGAVFAVHPAQVEAVAWISARADPMSTTFALVALVAWMRSQGWDRWYALAVAGSLLAILSKEAAAVVPALFVCLDLARPGARGWVDVRDRALRYVVPFAISALLFVIVKGLIEEARDLPLGHLKQRWWGGSYAVNLGVTLQAGAFQVIHAALPVRPSVDWYLPIQRNPLVPRVLLSALLHLVLLAGSARLTFSAHPRRRLFGAGVLAAYAGGAATSHVLFAVGIPTADRFLYLPLVGGCLAMACTADGLLTRRRTARGLAIAGVAALAVVSTVRAGVWTQKDRLWTEGPSGAFSPRLAGKRLGEANTRAADDLKAADALLAEGRDEEARALMESARDRMLPELEAAVTLNEFWRKQLDDAFVYRGVARLRRNLAAVLVRLEDYEGALEQAERAMEMDPEHARSHHALAVARFHLGRQPSAGWHMERALAIDEPAIPADDAARVLNGAARWRMDHGLMGAARRALRLSTGQVKDPAENGAFAALEQVDAIIASAREALPPASTAEAAMKHVAHMGVIEGDVEAAREAFLRGFSRSGEHPALRALWALATMEADDTEAGWKAARAYHEDTLRRLGADSGARLGLGRCLEALGDHAGAREEFRRVLGMAGADATVRGEAEAALDRLGGPR